MTWKDGNPPPKSSPTSLPSAPEQSSDASGQSERPASRSALFAAHLTDLAGYLRRRCGPLLRAKESVSDLAQSVCREALTYWSRFRSGSDRDRSLRKWLFHIARRKLGARQGYWNAAKRQEQRDPALDERPAAQLAPDASPSQQALLHEQMAELECAFARLTPDHRQVIELAYHQQLSHAEIARRLGRSEEAVRQLLSRALARLLKLTHGTCGEASGHGVADE
ncbi:MAG: sigma-70 family RNA polymerase sigma factor [Planctomycetota bacterium]